MGQRIDRSAALQEVARLLKASLILLDEAGEAIIALHVSQSIDLLDKKMACGKFGDMAWSKWDEVGGQDVSPPEGQAGKDLRA